MTRVAPAVTTWLASIPADRRPAIDAVRAAIRTHLPAGFVESIEYGMLSYVVPIERFADTYNGRPLLLAALASQKGYMSLYLTSIYEDPAQRAWFETAYRATGKRFDVGKSCVRFRSLDDLPLDVVGAAIGRVSVAARIAQHDAVHKKGASGVAAPKKSSAKKKASTKTPPKTVAKKTPPTKTVAKTTSRTKTVAQKKPARKTP